jgi:ABC-type sugar transport system ATPase subunit
MAGIALDSVSKVFPAGVRALDGVTLSAADGELLVLVGPSGCGKTTLLRVIAGLEEPTTGKVRLAGRDVSGVPPQERNIAAVFQDHALYPQLMVAQNLGFALRMRRTPAADIEQRVRDMAARLGVANLLDRYPHELSGGQRQRVAIGRALVRRPACCLLDEPLSHLDAGLRFALRAELRRLHLETGTTTLFVTHDPDEAMAVADRVAVLAAGRLLQVGPPREVYRRPAGRAVLEFFGTTPANILEVEVLNDGSDTVFESAGLRLALPSGNVRRGPAVLGFRAEAVSVVPHPGAAVFTLRVVSVEPHGADNMISGTTAAGFLLRVRAAAEPSVGALLRMHLPPDAIHLFEPGPDGRALTPLPPTG